MDYVWVQCILDEGEHAHDEGGEGQGGPGHWIPRSLEHCCLPRLLRRSMWG